MVRLSQFVSARPQAGASTRLLRLTAAAALLSTALALPSWSASAHSRATSGFVVGISNNLVGNGWREEMICSGLAEAAASNGVIKKVLVSDISGSAAQQVAGIRTLISQGVNALVIDPPDATSLNGVIQEASSRGIVVVIVDSFVKSPLAYQAANDQVAYGRLGMEWLAKQLHGKGNVVLLQGAAGVPADTDRYTGIKQALAEYPGVKVIGSVYTGWQFAPAGQDMLTLANAHPNINGVWTSGVDYTAVTALATAGRKYVPLVGADNNEFIHQLISLKGKGLVGAAVTNPATIGGVGMNIAIQVLQGKKVARMTKLVPNVWDNSGNLGTLQMHYLKQRSATYSVDWSVPGYTHYTQQQLFACKGPA